MPDTNIQTGSIQDSDNISKQHKHNELDGTQKIDSSDINGSFINTKSDQKTKTASFGTGDESITGLGFKPKCIMFTAHEDSAGTWEGVSHGQCDENLNQSVLFKEGTSWETGHNETHVIFVNASGGTDSHASVTSLDNDGFTLNWDGDTVAVVWQYLAIG